MSMLMRLARERSRTLLMVTHSVEAASTADRVLRLSRGQLVLERE
jgi:ABC-type lipoprotein export system ATPase subunit